MRDGEREHEICMTESVLFIYAWCQLKIKAPVKTKGCLFSFISPPVLASAPPTLIT